MRPILEYASPVWNPHLQRDIDLIERVQRSFTKKIPGKFNLTYPQRKAELNLQSLEERRVIADLAYLHKMIYGFVKMEFSHFFRIVGVGDGISTRGHSMKLQPVNPSGRDFRYIDCHKFFFTNRVVRTWNRLPAEIVQETSTATFKTKITEYLLINGTEPEG